ncbi:DUF2723 domain-containing protein, partial [bacterium]|nr:DUF2723 domain-containing protein [candidate division CSSED10-310 bacterium]
MTQRNRHTIPVFLAQITTLSVFSLLLGMTSPGISWGESALLTTRGWQLGSAHPPGYGGFLHLIHLAQHVLPLGDIAFRANIMGILIMAAASGLILLFMHSLKTPPVLALPHSITFAISLPVLSAVTSAEVYSLHLLLFLGIILILSRHSPRIPSIYSAAFLIGVAATHHLTFLILSPGILWLLATQLRHTKHRLRTASIAVTLLLFGLSAWIAFPIRESVAPAIVWGDASTIDGFMTLITAAEETRGSMRSGLSTISGILHRSRNLGSLLMSTLTLPGLLLAIPGVFTCIKFHRRLTLALCLSGFLLAGSVVIYHSNESASFFLPGLLIVSVFSITG